VVVREGKRVETIDLHHEDLPDPIIEMYRALQRRMDRIEARLARDESIGAEAGERVFPVEDERGEESDDDPRL
jgi:hypothetical protein